VNEKDVEEIERKRNENSTSKNNVKKKEVKLKLVRNELNVKVAQHDADQRAIEK
jgi:hypothetical protein